MSRLTRCIVTLSVLLALPFAAAAQETRGLKVACGSIGIELQLCEEGVREWSEKTGYPASIVSMPGNTSERLALYQQFLSAKEATIDVFQIDVVWPGVLQDHLLDLSPYVPKEEVERHFPSVISNNTIDGRLLAMPLYTDVGILYYRKDLLEKYKRPVPTTWEELTETAKVVIEGERTAGTPDMWGYVFQGRAYEGLTCNALEWVNSSGGGSIVSEDGKVTIVNQEALEAIQLAASWIGEISPKGVLNYGEEEARGVFQSGKSVFMRNWPYAWALIQTNGSPTKDKVGVTTLPSAKAGEKGSGTLGGWQMSVSKYSTQPEKAAELVRWLTGPEVQKKYALRATYNPTIMALYKDKEVLAALPASQVLYDALMVAVPRPSKVTGRRYNQVSYSFLNAVHAVLSGEMEAQDSLTALDKRLERIGKDGTWK
ncbi:MAG: ABC transporter substrate-binding protein [Alphaproteobacteria bacterium]|nr:ABC transporter substrate-binding protein [Alphaproteobacteria bacterium]